MDYVCGKGGLIQKREKPKQREKDRVVGEGHNK